MGLFDKMKQAAARTILDRSTPDERTPSRILPVGEVSSAAFFVYRAAILDCFL